MPLPRLAPSRLTAALGALVGATLLLGLLLAGLAVVQAGRILPGTIVAGVDIGGHTPEDATARLAPALAAVAERPLAVGAPGRRLHLDPQDVGLRFDVEATVRAAAARGRIGPRALLERLAAPVVDVALQPVGSVDKAALAAWVGDAADALGRDPSVGGLHIDATARTVDVTGPHGAVRIDRQASLAEVRTALLDPMRVRTALVARVSPPPSTFAAIEDLAARVTEALRAPRVLHHEGRRLIVPIDVLADLLEVRARPDGTRAAPELHVDHERLAVRLGEEASRTFDRSPAPARIDTGPPVAALTAAGSTTFAPVRVDARVLAEVTRTVWVPRRTAAQLVELVMAGERRAEADLLVVTPAFTADTLRPRRPTHLLGAFTTFHAAGGARTDNIRRLAAVLDRTWVAPGATLSINRRSGPRTCTAGYLPAGTIVRGELVDTCGGGVSQVGTTLLNAAFFAGVTLDEWQPHSFFIPRYPPGREATLTYPQLDVAVTNDTDGWLLVRTATTPTSITVELYGRPRWSTVRAEHAERADPRPFDTTVRAAEDVAPGEERVVQPGGEGFTITVRRIRTAGPAGTPPEVERWRTVYAPQQRIVEVNPADVPAVVAPPAADGAASDG